MLYKLITLKKEKIKFKGTLKLTDLFFIFVYPVLSAGIIYVLLSGGLSNFIDLAKTIVFHTLTNEYTLAYGSGPWFRYIIDFMLVSPWTVILCIGYIFYLVQNINKSDSKDIYFLTILLALFILYNLFTKNLRFVIILNLPIRLFSLLMLYKLITIKKEKIKLTIKASIVLLICVTDFMTFNHIFVKRKVYDPVSTLLLGARKMIPLKM